MNATTTNTNQHAGIANILGTIHALHILCPSTDFREWCKTYHGLEPSGQLFNGYLFAVRTIMRMLHDCISSNYSIELSEDFLFSRARFHGVHLSLVPHTCEIGTLTKNIHYLSRGLLGKKSWDQFDAEWNNTSVQLFGPFNELTTASVVNPAINHGNFDDILASVAGHEVYTFLNDTRRGLPMGYLQPMLSDQGSDPLGRPNTAYLSNVFLGYKLAVQFLWNSLLGSKFNQTQLASMHTASNWKELDNYFAVITDDLPDSLMNKMGFRVNDSLLVDPLVAKGKLAPFLVPLAPDPQLNPKQKLQQDFLWYEIELIDASESVFNGVMSFVTILSGTLEQRRRSGIRDKVYVARVVHPTEENGENDYSYGLLMEAASNTGFSDLSGWLLFYDCCGDYSGFAGSEHTKAEAQIREYRETGLIEVVEVTATKRQLLEDLDDYLVSTTKEVMANAERTRKRLEQANVQLIQSNGLLLELLTYYGLSNKQRVQNAFKSEWAYVWAGQEIDLLIQEGDTIKFVECKVAVNGSRQQGKDFLDKTALLLKDTKFQQEWDINDQTKIEHLFVVWERPSQDDLEVFQSFGLHILVLSEELKGSTVFPRSVRDRLRVAFGTGSHKQRNSRSMGIQ